MIGSRRLVEERKITLTSDDCPRRTNLLVDSVATYAFFFSQRWIDRDVRLSLRDRDEPQRLRGEIRDAGIRRRQRNGTGKLQQSKRGDTVLRELHQARDAVGLTHVVNVRYCFLVTYHRHLQGRPGHSRPQTGDQSLPTCAGVPARDGHSTRHLPPCASLLALR